METVLLPSLFLMVAMFNLTLVVVGLKELIIDRFDGTVADASLFFSIEMIAYMVFAPLWGLLSDRIGLRRPLVVIGFALSSAFYASFVFAPTLGSLLFLRFFQGAASVLAWSTLMTIVLDEPDREQRGRNLGIMGGALILGVSLGAPIGGYLMSHHGVERPLWVASALFALLALGSFALGDPRRQRPTYSLGQVLSATASQPRLIAPYLFYFVDRYTVGFFIVLFPLYLDSLGAGDPAIRGRYLAVFLGPFALLQIFTGRLVDRFGPGRPLILGSFLYGVALCAVGYSSLYGLWWVMLALGVLASVMFPPAIALTASYSSDATRGGAMGGFNFAGSLGFATGPLVGAWVFEAYGYDAAFVTAGSLEILVALVGLVLLRRWRRRADDAS